MMRLLPDLLHEFRRHKELADRALSSLDDEAFFHRPADHVNPIALIVKHLAGNLRSRWTDFLTSDGEKPDRDRDAEFVVQPSDSRDRLMSAWESGWSAVFGTLASLTENDLERIVTIRGEPHTVLQALLRAVDHVAYHTGQILYLARLLRPNREWLTIAPGQSRVPQGNYQAPSHESP